MDQKKKKYIIDNDNSKAFLLYQIPINIPRVNQIMVNRNCEYDYKFSSESKC